MNDIEFDDAVESRAYERIQAAGATALSLLLAAGLGAWLLLDPGSGESTTSPAPASEKDPPVPVRSFDQGDGAGDTAVGPRSPDMPAVYLVATQEHANAVLIAIYEAAAIRNDFGEPFVEDRVVVLDSEDAEERFARAIQEQDAVRGGMGLPPFRVVDLRARRRRRPRSRAAPSPTTRSRRFCFFRFRITEKYLD